VGSSPYDSAPRYRHGEKATHCPQKWRPTLQTRRRERCVHHQRGIAHQTVGKTCPGIHLLKALRQALRDDLTAESQRNQKLTQPA